ncbi:AmmeMemoRadiSam system radical SAM enzyme [Desulfovibrio psychrotolerans]|uniref:AmmeMemoRadiSam system radical SAM enzyme n=1 Tax=Desulfovibrio psychrotolerans TaxID=415242 RepID=A0A7J0BNN5_9BACT|nr:AmmeMemoRadiSam system radical SAM enzyme [Desulfovibrio psychrotolerans]GFM35337.1 AmmeMemoRadiSam system radical SAM enzyme [Desulfovibrio psychrotolerans]
MMYPAAMWKPLKDATVQCCLCAHACVIRPGKKGQCGVRSNHDGALFTETYHAAAALNLDPVEKKPLHHFLPGSATLSLGTMGCNMRCDFCQNYSLSAPPRTGKPITGQSIPPAMLVAEALRCGAKSISYTYSEPTVFFELMQDTARLAADNGLLNIMVSNGFQSTDCLNALNGLIHACNIDLKAFSDVFYKERCGARLLPVLENLRHIRRMGWWLEVTTLLIPDANDTDAEIRAMATFIHDELGSDVPWHISRFHPAHKMLSTPPTTAVQLEQAWQIGKDTGLHYVYIGNLHGHPSEHTSCPSCGNIVVRRTGYKTTVSGIPACSKCGVLIPGIWNSPPGSGKA